MKVKKELPKLVISLAVIPLILIALITFYSVSKASSNTYRRYLGDLSEAVSKQLNDYYSYQTNSILYSGTISIYKQYLESNESKYHLYDEVSNLLNVSSKNNVNLDKNMLVDMDGIIVSSSDKNLEGLNVRDQDYLNFTSAYFWKLTKIKGVPKVVVSTKILGANKKPLGFLINFYNINYINNSLRNYKIGKTGYLYVLDDTGEIISHYYNNYAGKIKINKNNKELLNLVTNIKTGELKEKNGFIRYKKSKNNILANYKEVTNNKWVVVVAIEEKEVYSEAIIVCIIILLMTIVVYIIAVKLSLKTVKRIITPIESLSDNIKKIAQGDLTQKIDYENNDEFKPLYDDINNMAENLKETTKNLQEHASIDGLTKIANRYAIYNIMEKCFDSTKQQASIMMDLNNFKTINDNFGHPIGDLVLIKTAEILSKYETKNIYFSRLGGDEFFGFVTEYSSREEIISMLKNIYSEIKKIKEINEIKIEGNINVSASIGVAFSNFESDYKELMKKADIAMYKSKKAKNIKIAIYKEK